MGGNKGQSLAIFKEIFEKPIIHTFEPIKSEFDQIYEKYKSDLNITFNNYALGEIVEEKILILQLKLEHHHLTKLIQHQMD